VSSPHHHERAGHGARGAQLLRAALGLIATMIAHAALAGSLTPLGEAPDWSRLDVYQKTITRGEFTRLLDTLYAPGGAARRWIHVNDRSAWVRVRRDEPNLYYRLSFAEETADGRARAMAQVPRAVAGQLEGMRVALDPGHIGGAFAAMEGREFRVGDDPPVREGELVLEVARRQSSPSAPACRPFTIAGRTLQPWTRPALCGRATCSPIASIARRSSIWSPESPPAAPPTRG